MSKQRMAIIAKCKSKLLKLKKQYEKTITSKTSYSNEHEIIDKATQEQYFHQSQFFRHRFKNILPEINLALQRIQQGDYGLCEVSGGEIEDKRLLAIPWTRVSIKALNYQSTP
jgi:DnaK suppressor protein